MKKIFAAYFSATGTTKKIVTCIADAIEGGAAQRIDFTLPSARDNKMVFSEDDIVIFGVPVYAGRVPNVLLKYLNTIEGGGAKAVPIVVYGNRNYDDALIELCAILENDGFHNIAAAAFIGEHSFSRVLAAGRPDEADLALARNFAHKIDPEKDGHLKVRGENPIRGYYQPQDRNGNHINILKVKPLTSPECIKCGLCARTCPMGSISADDPSKVEGICIKCGSCVKKCPVGAKYYGDEGYLYHKKELEEMYSRRAEPEIFL